jgi:formylglycine-generating enzyme required for sulfatase activity
MGAFAEIGSSAKLLDAERAALAALAAEFPMNQYPDLRKLLELAPGSAPPFLIVAAEFFFKGQIRASETLARVVGYDLQIAILREQREGKEQIAQVVLKLDEQSRALTQLLSLQRSELRPQDGCSMHDETERRLVRSLLKQFRDLPAEMQPRLSDLLGDLGRLAFAAGEFKESRAASSEAARLAPAQSAQAASHHNAYLASLEDRDWLSALESLLRAAELDAPRFMPFPFDKYVPAGILGAGGFGVAFLCEHRFMGGRRVVVKTLQAAQLGRDLTELFREAAVLESLDHGGIVRVRDAAYADAQCKRPYLVMDWFDGPSLEDHVQAHGPMPLEQALEMGRQLAEALAAAHERGILHRDVKPRNVLIRVENRSASSAAGAPTGGTAAQRPAGEGTGGTARVQVKLIDFGLALQQSTARTLASGNTLLGSSQTGTLDYAAPEQLGKLPGVKPGPYSDVYSWARTLCFALFRTPNPRPRQFQMLSEAMQDLLDDSLGDAREDLAKRPATMDVLLKRLAACAAPVAPPARVPAPPPPLAPKAAVAAPALTPSIAAPPPPKIVAPKPTPAPIAPPREVVNSLGGKFVRIEPGTFTMGEGREQHKVTLTRPFYMQATPVTQAQWKSVMETAPSRFKGDTLPVEQVNWTQAVDFCACLGKKEGKKYRLPTEAEWEYACRAGTTTGWYTGDDEKALAAAAWYSANSDSKTHPVATKTPNEWGLYDMAGNVWEWCHDVYGAVTAGPATDPAGPEQLPNAPRVLRGGSRGNDPVFCRSAFRINGAPDYRSFITGFRVVLDSP